MKTEQMPQLKTDYQPSNQPTSPLTMVSAKLKENSIGLYSSDFRPAKYSNNSDNMRLPASISKLTQNFAQQTSPVPNSEYDSECDSEFAQREEASQTCIPPSPVLKRMRPDTLKTETGCRIRGRCPGHGLTWQEMGVVCVFIFWMTVVSSADASSQRHHPGKIVTSKGVNPDEFLHHFGYLPDDHDLWRHIRRSRKRAVSLYQQSNGLHVTGRVNKQTWRLMQQPRCGYPDIGSPTLPVATSQSERHSRVARSTGTKAKQMSTNDYQWQLKRITWRPTRFLPKLSVYTQWRTLKKAFDTWSQPSQLTVSYDAVNPDIRVSFWSREHGDGDGNAFDGKGKVLAHAFPPGDADIAGDIHFDADEPWSVGRDSNDTKDLLMIAMHEAGHAVGLGHSLKKKDIMYPVYGEFTPEPGLSRHDVRRLQYLYGKNPKYRWTPPPPPSLAKKKKKAVLRRSYPRWCRMPFNDVIRGPYGRGYIFSKRYVYRFTHEGVQKGYPVHVRQEFPRAPINPLAVVHVREGTHTFFFKGDRYWRYTNYTLDIGYPRRLLSPFPEKPRAALNLRDRKGHSSVFIFGDGVCKHISKSFALHHINRALHRRVMLPFDVLKPMHNPYYEVRTKFFWQWSHVTEDVSSSFLYITDFWAGLPSKVDAAVQWSDNYIYFFRHRKYYKISRDNHDLELGYPKIKGPAWLRGDCGYEPK